MSRPGDTEDSRLIRFVGDTHRTHTLPTFTMFHNHAEVQDLRVKYPGEAWTEPPADLTSPSDSSIPVESEDASVPLKGDLSIVPLPPRGLIPPGTERGSCRGD